VFSVGRRGGGGVHVQRGMKGSRKIDVGRQKLLTRRNASEGKEH